MAEKIRLTKNELRLQQKRLVLLQRYLPTLQLKKAMLQSEVQEARHEIQKQESIFKQQFEYVSSFSELLTLHSSFNVEDLARIKTVQKRYENIAGVEIPNYTGIEFEPLTYSLLDTPPWIDAAVVSLRALTEAKVRVDIAKEKRTALEKELRSVSIRVNLFEKILIPRAQNNIKRIKVFLGDQFLAAVSQSKAAKNKIVKNRELQLRELADTITFGEAK